jgi:hypothetical protein
LVWVDSKLYLASARGLTLNNNTELFSFGGGKWLAGSEPSDDDAWFPAQFSTDKDLVILEHANLPDGSMTAQIKNYSPMPLGGVVRLLHAAGKLKVNVIHHTMATVTGTGDYSFTCKQKLSFVLDKPNAKQKDPKDPKLKAELFGAKLPAGSVRSSSTLQVIFRVKAFAKKDMTEIAPVRPMALLRSSVTLQAGEAVRLL